MGGAQRPTHASARASPRQQGQGHLILNRITLNQDSIFRVKTKKSLLELYLEMRWKITKCILFISY